MFPKTLVLNVNGTLVHSEYKVSILPQKTICIFSLVSALKSLKDQVYQLSSTVLAVTTKSLFSAIKNKATLWKSPKPSTHKEESSQAASAVNQQSWAQTAATSKIFLTLAAT